MKISKGWIFAALLVLMVLVSVFALADIKINNTNFPDAAFRKIVKSFDSDKDGILNDSEIINISSIQCENKGIESLKGIEYFTSLSSLNCKDNKLSTLDLSNNSQLWSLYCENNQLTSLNVSGCPSLSLLYCCGNKLTALNLKKNSCLEWLKCENNNITSLNLSGCPKIIYVICSYNNMDNLTLKNNNALNTLDALGNRYQTLDVSTCKRLDWVVKNGANVGSCNFTGWIADSSPYGESGGSSQILLYLPSGTRVITRVDVTSITLNSPKISVVRTAKEPNPAVQLTATVLPDNATNKAVKWSSSNTKVAKVNKNGKITILKKGGTIITCTAKDGTGVKATCKISVKNRLVSSIVLNRKTLSLTKGKTYQLKVKSIKPSDAINRNVKWSSSNKAVAAVDSKGKITAVGQGTCVITCKAKDGSGVKMTCRITVK